MTPALDFALIPPEVLEAIVAQVTAKLSLVISRPGLSTLPASIRRRECERRLAASRRSEEIGGSDRVKSTKPESVRRRKSEQNKANRGAEKGPIGAIDRPLLDLQPVETGEATAGGALRADRIPPGTHGPLASDVASLVGRITGYAESARKRDLAWLYEEATRIFRGELGLRLPERWSGPKDWGAAKVLIREYKREEILEAIRAACKGWKPSAKYPTRPTLGLVLFQLRRDRAAAPPPDSRRMTGEQLEDRDRARGRAAAAPPMTTDPSSSAADRSSSQMPGNPKNEERSVEPDEAAQEHHERQHLDPFHGTSSASTRVTPAPPVGPRDLRGTPPTEVRGKIAEILEQLEQRRGGGPP